jgi:hypothetical protein
MSIGLAVILGIAVLYFWCAGNRIARVLAVPIIAGTFAVIGCVMVRPPVTNLMAILIAALSLGLALIVSGLPARRDRARRRSRPAAAVAFHADRSRQSAHAVRQALQG